MKRMLLLAALSLIATNCHAWAPAEPQTLAEARRDVDAGVTHAVKSNLPLAKPPAGVLEPTSYESAVGRLAAYITPRPKTPGRHPALIWISGGDFTSIGDFWTPAPAGNDQTASAFRRPEIVLMYPSQRGGNRNPGTHEGFYGEVDDVNAALAHLESLDYVDPARIYLAGHSTGGTLVMLVSEMTDGFRAAFAFGPLADPAPYAQMLGPDFLPFDVADTRSMALRSPGRWLASVRTPLFVLEGDQSPGNLFDLNAMKAENRNPRIQFLTARDHDHFSILAPVTALIAGKIVADTGPATAITHGEAEIAAMAGK